MQLLQILFEDYFEEKEEAVVDINVVNVLETVIVRDLISNAQEVVVYHNHPAEDVPQVCVVEDVINDNMVEIL